MDNSHKTGYIFAITAFALWGLAPIYFKAISNVSPFEIVAHRAVWSALFLGGILYIGNRNFIRELISDLSQDFWLLLLAALLLTSNWLVFIYAISSGRILEASLGYYINPLLNVALGALLLNERFSVLQKVAIGLAITGVAQEVFRFGQLPWISLFLASSFAVYGFIRKHVKTGGAEGLLVETLIMLPFAVAYLVYLNNEMTLSFYYSGLSTSVLLFLAGIVTSLPLIFFIGASKRIKYSTLGLFQYIGPTLMGVLGYYFYDETFPPGRLITFALIWAGLSLTIIESVKKRS